MIPVPHRTTCLVGNDDSLLGRLNAWLHSACTALNGSRKCGLLDCVVDEDEWGCSYNWLHYAACRPSRSPTGPRTQARVWWVDLHHAAGRCCGAVVHVGRPTSAGFCIRTPTDRAQTWAVFETVVARYVAAAVSALSVGMTGWGAAYGVTPAHTASLRRLLTRVSPKSPALPWLAAWPLVVAAR